MIYDMRDDICIGCRITFLFGCELSDWCDKCRYIYNVNFNNISKIWKNRGDLIYCYNFLHEKIEKKYNYSVYRPTIRDSVLRAIPNDQLDDRIERIFKIIEARTIELQDKKDISNQSVLKILTKRDTIINIFEKIIVDEGFLGDELNLKRVKLGYLFDIIDRINEIEETL